MCTVDGQRFSIGDATIPFCLQSLARPITYGITLDELDGEVHTYQGREPSGRKFGEIVLDQNSNLLAIIASVFGQQTMHTPGPRLVRFSLVRFSLV